MEYHHRLMASTAKLAVSAVSPTETPEVLVDEVMGLGSGRLAAGVPFGASVGEFTHQFLLLGIDADDGLGVFDERPGGLVEVVELGVSIGTLGAFLLLGGRLERVAQLVQQAPHQLSRDAVALAHQLIGQHIGRFGRPAGQRHRVAPRRGMDQLVEGDQEAGLLVDGRLVPATGCPLAIVGFDTFFDFTRGTDHRVAADARGLGHLGLAAPSEQRRRRSHNDPALTLVEVRKHGLEVPDQLLG
jgi:hypothetical protein